MSLKDFKHNLRFTVVIIFLIVYGLGFYLIGKNSSLVNKFKVKGVSSQKAQESTVDVPVPFADTQTATVTASQVKLCANTQESFQLSYPQDWFTTYNTEDEKCNFFAPYSFVVPYSTQSFQVPIKLETIDPAQWLGSVDFYQNPNDFHNFISEQNMVAGGKAVKKIELSSTGISEIPRGFVQMAYLIFDDETPIIITYQQLDEKENVVENKKIVEEMVVSLQYF